MKILIEKSLSKSIEIDEDGNKYFTPDALALAKRTMDSKSRTILIYMLPEMFLKLAKALPNGPDLDKVELVGSILNSKKQLNSIPLLSIDGKGKVRSHEGRHRSLALKDLRVKEMPVLFTSDNIRWQQQLDPTSYDYIPDKHWPKNIQGQTSGTYPFPIQRKDLTTLFRKVGVNL